jgi:hypothetical protein
MGRGFWKERRGVIRLRRREGVPLVCVGGAFDGRAFDGRAFDGRVFDGRVFDGRTFDGRTFDGRPHVRWPHGDKSPCYELRPVNRAKAFVRVFCLS